MQAIGCCVWSQELMCTNFWSGQGQCRFLTMPLPWPCHFISSLLVCYQSNLFRVEKVSYLSRAPSAWALISGGGSDINSNHHHQWHHPEKNVSIHENKQMISNGAPQKWGTEICKNGFHMLLMNGARSCSVLSVSEQCPDSLPDSGLSQ